MTELGLAEIDVSVDEKDGISIKLDGREISSEISGLSIRMSAGDAVTATMTFPCPTLNFNAAAKIKLPEWVETYFPRNRKSEND